MNNVNNLDNMPKVKRESKNKIRVEFERTPLKERLKAKFLSTFFLQKVVWYVFRLVLLVGIAYVVLYPFISKIMGSFMSPADLIDATVILIPKNWNIDIYKGFFGDSNVQFWSRFLNTLMLSGSSAILQTFTCAFIAYGLAKFKFKGGKYIFLAVILTMVIPHDTIGMTMYNHFKEFDMFGIFKFLGGGGINFFDFQLTSDFLEGINIAPHEMITDKTGELIVKYTGVWTDKGVSLINTNWPMIILSLTGLGFKNGLYIFLFRQFFRGVPDELEESAYMDGSGVFSTFVRVIIPLSVPMLITVFIFSFSWQWTDNFYTTLFYVGGRVPLLHEISDLIPQSMDAVIEYEGQALLKTVIRNTSGLIIIMPLVILYVFCQNFLVQGIERSGLTAD